MPSERNAKRQCKEESKGKRRGRRSCPSSELAGFGLILGKVLKARGVQPGFLREGGTYWDRIRSS